jgi:alkylation response protein AidB-like acyl-CoA dehydrogenase
VHAFAFGTLAHHNVTGIVASAKPELANRYLPQMLTGSRIGVFCLTEAGAGCDAAAITTTVRPADGGWLLSGQKSWIRSGGVADVSSVYVQTDPNRGWRGIGCFLVGAQTPGLIDGPAYNLMGGHVMQTNGMTMNECIIPR